MFRHNIIYVYFVYYTLFIISCFRYGNIGARIYLYFNIFGMICSNTYFGIILFSKLAHHYDFFAGDGHIFGRRNYCKIICLLRTPRFTSQYSWISPNTFCRKNSPVKIWKGGARLPKLLPVPLSRQIGWCRWGATQLTISSFSLAV